MSVSNAVGLKSVCLYTITAPRITTTTWINTYWLHDNLDSLGWYLSRTHLCSSLGSVMIMHEKIHKTWNQNAIAHQTSHDVFKNDKQSINESFEYSIKSSSECQQQQQQLSLVWNQKNHYKAYFTLTSDMVTLKHSSILVWRPFLCCSFNHCHLKDMIS